MAMVSLCSFVAQSDDGIYARCPASGDVAGCQGHDGEQDGDGGEIEGIGGADAIEQRTQEARQDECGCESRGNSEQSKREALFQNEAQDIGALSAEREANADFTGALADEKGDDTIDANHAENQGKS